MIPPELVRARRRGDRLGLTKLAGAELSAALGYAEELLLAAGASVGSTQDELEEALDSVEREARHDKLFLGLKKMVLDACEVTAPLELDAAELRRVLFTEAAEVRRTLEPGEPFPRERLIAEAAAQRDTTPEVIEEALYGDLRGAQRLLRAPEVGPEAARSLAARYETAELQGILLRAVRVTLKVRSKSTQAYRRLFQRLKFRRLLAEISHEPDGRYRIDIDGPFSMFESVTRYGLALGQLVPVLEECDEVELSAELRWGKERRHLIFETKLGGGAGRAPAFVDERPEVSELALAIERRRAEGKTTFTAEATDRLFDLPGIGVIAADLVLRHSSGQEVFVEVLGFWSRDAVWKRVEWARSSAGGPRVVFAASSRLRVSEAVVPDDASAALYVYKGTMNAKSLLDRAEGLIDDARAGDARAGDAHAGSRSLPAASRARRQKS